jgi:4-carboxymuconolactone decarboxylase
MKKTLRRSAASRFPVLRPEQLTPEQTRVLQSLIAGPRGKDGTGLDSVTRFLTRGPFNAWLRSPELGELLQKVGAHIRFRSSLPPRLNELAILITARHWTSQFEWYAHRLLALKAGLGEKLIDEIARNRRPKRMRADEAAVYEFCVQLHRKKNVTDAAYRRAVALLGEQGVMDMIGASGYYTAVSMTLNVAKVSLPAGEKIPLK